MSQSHKILICYDHRTYPQYINNTCMHVHFEIFGVGKSVPGLKNGNISILIIGYCRGLKIKPISVFLKNYSRVRRYTCSKLKMTNTVKPLVTLFHYGSKWYIYIVLTILLTSKCFEI